ncbi:UDP-N-acetylmuramoyl-tripeptide--D-alanyl-D-alanine ligase [Pseudodesulfovibrio sp. zrk46]|uniref:UDP-N-acetylmuramoyl-tripeptide--D-alanyl-D- alanine ligase n=1 Tax=Pseudodesulfovibrio sp. zrk46 TaxID=2725288 RepID=UPI001449FA8C|nr:UDP-N-acetylmuramoyl-tripeptide--D-alanyl-D-alanine ligase [Pseudodesulfovibrio sp. zrk46]QJB55396.1 UDP-N-acetylmuramoyl-tripeptide--D-alanyl-D-alanine ligase [Pseudodesulfovibrio sp. zrk46]
MNLTLADVERCLTGMAEEGHDQIGINTVQTDSRTVSKGDLFFCIDGENFDGHEFAAQAVKNGAAAVVSGQFLELDAPMVMVRDTTRALGQLAACWRKKCGAKLVGVTGTAGKTTVKEMLYAVASQKYSTAKNYRNFNNQIGLPMSMLKASEEQELWIMELGISVRGDMEELATIATPDVAVITNVGAGHLEGLGDENGVAEAKTTLLKHLHESGTAIVGMDYPLLWDAAREIVDAPIGFSAKENTDTSYVASFLGAEAEGWGRFRLRTPEGDGEFTAPFCGEHYAENLACVAAAAHQLGITRDEVIKGVQTLTADSQRFCCKIAGNAMVIDDTYNANPLSMARSIETAAKMAEDRPLVLVLGDMRELGEEAIKRHEELGRLIKDVAPRAMFYKGDHYGDVICGMGEDSLTRTTGPEDFIKEWRTMGLSGAVILVKGSRSLKMEEFANALCRELDDAGMGA